MRQRSLPAQKQMTAMLGHPVAENPIDLMFDSAYAHYGLPWQFWKCDVASEQMLGAAIGGVRALGFAGACITVPYKVASLEHVDDVDDDVKAIGATNYVTIEGDRLIAHNNDGKGVVKAIAKVVPIEGKRVVMLGAGGAGRAMAVELAWAGASHLTLVTRREEQGTEVAGVVTRASNVPAEWMPWNGDVIVPEDTDILMNATTLGSWPALEHVAVDWSTVGSAVTAVDVITNPRITPFLQAAEQNGCAIVSGVEMLVQLGMQIFTEWTGVRPDELVFQSAVAAALGEPEPGGSRRTSFAIR